MNSHALGHIYMKQSILKYFIVVSGNYMFHVQPVKFGHKQTVVVLAISKAGHHHTVA